MSEKYKIRDQDKLYFITFAVVAWVDVFTRPEYKQILIDSLKYCQQQKGLEIYGWCLMSNHIHLILRSDGKNKLQDIIRDFKKFTSVSICRSVESNGNESRKDWMLKIFDHAADSSSKHLKYQFWQNEYHPIVLNNNKIMDQKLEYIHNYPVKEEVVGKPEDYLYSSAKDYCGVKGLLNIKFIE